MVYRVIDVCIAVVGLCALAGPMLLIAILIKLDSSGGVIFRQKRVGRALRPFTIYKFRTTVVSFLSKTPGDATVKSFFTE